MRKLYRKRLNEVSLGGFSGFGGFGGSGSQQPQQGGPAQPGSVTAAAANGTVSNKSLPLRVNFCKSVMITHPQTNQKIEMFEALVSNVRYNQESNLCAKLNQFIKSNFGDKTIVATVAEKTSNSKQQNGQQPQKSVIAGFIKLKINPSCINDIMLGWADDIGNFLTSLGYNA